MSVGVPPAESPAQALPNPALRLDASLGLVVLEFRQADGTTRTIPNERELAAYRSAAQALRPIPQAAVTAEPGVAADQRAPGVPADPTPVPEPAAKAAPLPAGSSDRS